MLPAFWSYLTDDDIAVIKRQKNGRRFDPKQVYAVGCRCSYGYPQVVVCNPITKNLTPFPTLFWLTCPYLDRKCGELESMHKIQPLEEALSAQEDKVILWHKEYSVLRMMLIDDKTADSVKDKNISMWESLTECGVGGINWKENASGVKCLHLQTATWLGMRSHPAADLLMRTVGEAECGDGFCRGFADKNSEIA